MKHFNGSIKEYSDKMIQSQVHSKSIGVRVVLSIDDAGNDVAAVFRNKGTDGGPGKIQIAEFRHGDMPYSHYGETD